MGLCVLCSRPAYKGWRCKKHYEQHKITMRLRYIPKVRGRYKVGGPAGAEQGGKKAASKASPRTAAKKVAARKTSTKKSASKAATRKTTARKTTARRSTARRSARA